MTTPDTDTLAGLHETLGGVTVPNIMHGDNLAITLCTAYDNPDQDADETGWTPDALAGQEAVLGAIRDHYDPAIKCAIALRAQAAKDKARIERLEAALRPFAKAGELFTAPEHMDYYVVLYNPAAGQEFQITEHHVRAARAVLEDGE